MIPLALPTILDIAIRHAPDLIGLVLGGKVKVSDLAREVGEIARDVLGSDEPPKVESTIAADPAAADAFRARLVALAEKQLDFAGEVMRAEQREGPWSYGWRRLLGWSIAVSAAWQMVAGPIVSALAGLTMTAPYAEWLGAVGVLGAYLMGGHTLKEVMGGKR